MEKIIEKLKKRPYPPKDSYKMIDNYFISNNILHIRSISIGYYNYRYYLMINKDFIAECNFYEEYKHQRTTVSFFIEYIYNRSQLDNRREKLKMFIKKIKEIIEEK